MDLNIILDALGRMIASGWMSLLDYLAAHVLLCLMPAFIIAGYMSAMIPKEAITRYLGPRANRWISYPAAAVGGFVLAVCSCTILPLFAGIWKRGAGLGPAITFLFVGPAVNILAIAYTGAAIGMDIALARIVLSIVFGIGIGLTMAWFFRAEEARRSASMAESGIFDQEARVPRVVWALFLLLIGVLIVGTLQVEPLTGTWFSLHLPVTMPEALTQALAGLNLNFQGALLIMLLILIAPVAYLGLENVLEGFNGWTRLAIALVALTVLVAAPRFAEGSLTIEIRLWETWRFVKQIFPLLIVGVFAAGMVKAILPETWIQTLAGRNTVWANLIGVLFGVFMYCPTLVEVPIARMFLDLGMHRGPLLAYLLADPELSLQSILVTGRILGRKKTAVYVSLVTVASTLAGWIFGLLLVTF